MPAKDAYRYPAFAGWRQTAEASDSPWLIFSTKYGLIDPGQLIANYDRGTSDARKDPEFRTMVVDQAGEALAGASEIVVLGSENHAILNLLRDVLPERAHQMRLEPVG